MDLGLGQRRVAEILDANPWTYLLWEHDRTRPTPRFVPGILKFLEYDPLPKGQTLGERLRAARRALGLSHGALARKLGVDPSTVLNWERGRHTPPVQYVPRIVALTGPEHLAAEASLPERIRAYRRRHGLTQAELGRILGIHQSVISSWETGRTQPDTLGPQLARRVKELLSGTWSEPLEAQRP